MNYRRVHIFGGAGSGKTTLAKRYAVEHGLVHRQLDDIYYIKASTRERREHEERDTLLSTFIEADEWVTEGIFWQPWVRPALQRADKIIVLAVPESTRHVRVIRRHFQLLKQASSNEWPTFFPTLFELLKHNRAYNTSALHETLELVSEFEDKVSVCSRNTEAEQILGLS